MNEHGTSMKRQQFTVMLEAAVCPQCGDEGEDLSYHAGTGMYYCESCWADHEDRWTVKE